MIVEKSNDIEQFGALQGETVAMGFAEGATGHLMDVLAKNLYSRPKEAMLREYSTNALDAQIEIGETRPIEITLPSALNPVLVIQDFGVGLDMDGIRKVYSQYGASTKRDTNDLNGTLGLGGKSAFAYSNRFTVVSIKNGVRIEVAVTRNEDGTAEMVVVDERLSILPRGTTIKVPTKRGDNFKTEAAKLYKWFPEGTVLVNGQAPERFDPTAEGVLEVSAGMYVVKHKRDAWSRATEDDLIVMGNIAYPTDALDSGLDKNVYHMVIFVPNGSVQFAPSREALLLNSVTRRKLDDLKADFERALTTTLQKHIDAATTRWDAAAVVADWSKLIPVAVQPKGGWKYKGEAIPGQVVIEDTKPYARVLPLVKTGYHNRHDKKRKLGRHRFKSALWVEGFTPDTVTASHAQKARKYIADNGLDAPSGIILINEIPANLRPWIQHVITYDDVKNVKLPRQQHLSSASGRIPGSYDLITTEQAVLDAYYGANHNSKSVVKHGVPAEAFRHWKTPLFYTTGPTFEAAYLVDGLLVSQGSKGFTLVCMRSDRVAKFQRNFPAAQEAKQAIEEASERWVSTLDSDTLLALELQRDRWVSRQYARLDPAKIHDPELSRYVRLLKLDVSKLLKIRRAYQRAQASTGPSVELIDFTASDLYPLMDEDCPTHTIFYVNAVYAARQNGIKL